ncbi:amino acid/amide ABC transporter membrane protein 1, HAAT family [Rhizobium sp. RU35A]|uniref:branched-chain amino acid ABC transporter permease n=1 Tax=Rhizobium sp. RU35A TaxID=1907414 RepID=UPI0009572A4A|nr:branched-chain amino acid ABC transporter permease [Rhizobium sp. RU35A]SIQ30097.1 amino acid/amide ABC transporter membrane protein 1, HAAT family [Rhizobium sp. RU35A]
MSLDIILILLVDGLSTGAIYLLAGLGFVLVFSVTRVIFIPSGDIAAFAALTLAAFQGRTVPGSIWLVAAMAGLACLAECSTLLRNGATRRIPRALLLYGVLPLIPCGIGLVIARQDVPEVLRILTTIALILPMGVLIDRLMLRPLAASSTLILFIVAIAAHYLIAGIGLIAFGPEGVRTTPILDGIISLSDSVVIPAQQLLMMIVALLLSLVFYLFFGRSMTGKALRATASNRVGARLVGIRPERAATMAYLIASGLAAIVGILIAPVTTMYYDSGFMIGLKASVGAIIGGMASYPITAIGSVFVGVLESWASFLASDYKEIIIFSAVIPVLIWRSFSVHRDGDEEIEEFA